MCKTLPLVVSNNVSVPIVVEEDKYLPKYQSADAVCLDLVAKIPPKTFGGITTGKNILLSHRSSAKIDTGIKVAVPKGYKLCIAARSSLAEKGLVVTNAPGQIDSDYRGPIQVLVLNVGREIVEIKDGERFAQCWLEKVIKVKWEQVQELDATERNDGGFGSTGA